MSKSDILSVIGRSHELFDEDLRRFDQDLTRKVKSSSFLVVGGAGSIGQAVVRQIFSRSPRALHVVDLSENSLVELVRDIRSTLGYISGDFRTFALDLASLEFQALLAHHGPYDYVLNLSALKHVRSEKDPFTLSRMFRVNITNAVELAAATHLGGSQKYFCVSTDKAANPANMMGATKRIMELFLMSSLQEQRVSMARFANVAFSDGSLLHGFNQRFLKSQPLSAPSDVKRYFITPDEAGLLCLFSTLEGERREIFFPNHLDELALFPFSEIAIRFLLQKGYEPYLCDSEDEARSRCLEMISKKKWPCYFFESDTTGEKPFEEFYTADEVVDVNRYKEIGVIEFQGAEPKIPYQSFADDLLRLHSMRSWSRGDLLDLIQKVIPEFAHLERGKFLDERM